MKTITYNGNLRDNLGALAIDIKHNNINYDNYSINFGGFYNSVYTDLISSEEEYILEDLINYKLEYDFDIPKEIYSVDNETYTDLQNILIDNMNYKGIREDMSKQIFDNTKEYIIDNFMRDHSYNDDDLKFIALDSPTYYNYTTDKFEISISDKFLLNIVTTLANDTCIIDLLEDDFRELYSENKHRVSYDDFGALFIEWILDNIFNIYSPLHLSEGDPHMYSDDTTDIFYEHIANKFDDDVKKCINEDMDNKNIDKNIRIK